MKFERYRRAMDRLPVSGDFGERALKRLERARRRRRAARWAVPAAAAVAAACLALTLLPSGFWGPVSVCTLPLPASDSTAAPASRADGAGAFELAETADGSALAKNWNCEEYAYIAESGYRSARTSPLSTFAADVDTASYANLRRMVLDGSLPPADAVRIEEMLNYFSYRGLAPGEGDALKISTALTGCPWNEEAQLLFVGVGAEEIATDELPSSNLVFLIDVSGSMDAPDKLDLVKRAFHLLAEGLRPGDRVSIVTYAANDRVALAGADGAKTAQILAAVDDLTAGGSTNGAAGIETAYALAAEYFLPEGNNRVVLMTDGDLNVGVTSEAALTALIEEKRETGVFLSVLGFGSGNLKDNKLEALADHGNGNYAYIDTVAEARKVLVEELGATFHTVCKDVKLQVEFNPAAVKGYRLIGYENRLLAAEDFADDDKDGGEMGSGHTVVALYEVIPAGSAFAIPEAELAYQAANPAASDAEVATVSVRYKKPDASKSELLQAVVDNAPVPVGEMSDAWRHNLNLACAVAEAGMLLGNSDYRGSASYDEALALLSEIPDPDDLTRELACLLDRVRALSASPEGSAPAPDAGS